MSASFKRLSNVIKRLTLCIVFQIIGVVYYMWGLASSGLQRQILVTVGSGIVFIATAMTFLNAVLFVYVLHKKDENGDEKTPPV